MENKAHQILEASAGTGKTYKISEIVIEKILSEIPIKNILVMTFTEAAAEELRNRIRNRIKEELDKKNSEPLIFAKNIVKNSQTLLQNALTDFDQATICTIHGFCKNILESYAFECRLSFHTSIINNPEVYEDAFYEQLYKNADDFKSFLNLVKPAFYKEEYFKNMCIDIAQKLHKNDKISPEYCNINETLKEMESSAKEIFDLKPDFFKKLIENLKEKKIHGSTKKSLINILERLESTIKNSCDLISLAKNLNLLSKNDKDKITGNQEGFLSDDLADNISDIIDKNNKIAYFLVSKFTHNTVEIADETNRQLLQFTYNDLIQIVAERINEKNSSLLRELRKKYWIGIIDEFQDTNPLQWAIIKKIFTNSDKSANRYIITAGDPKQSIYSFQGANTETYKDAIKSISNEKHIRMNLDTNYRTHRHLIGIFNQIFEHKQNLMNSNWFPKENYIPILSIPENHKNYTEVNKNLNKDYKHLTLITFDNLEIDKYKIQKNYAFFISREIKKFMNTNPYERFRLSHVFVLVRNRKEADIIEDTFKKMAVPYTFYKKSGIYTSEESNNLYYILRAIAYPNKSKYLKEALLTNFFCVPVKDLLDINNLELSKISNLFSKWREDNTISNIPKLIKDIYTDTKILERSLAKDLGSERTYSNYMQIARVLENYALSEKRSIHDILDFFKSLRYSQQKEIEDEDIEELDTEKDKVKIMTMHSSKGLESGIIFIAGGWRQWNSKSNKKSYYDYSHSEGKEYDLLKSDEKLYNITEKEEEKRLFYVAMTRAKYMLYMPMVPEKLNNLPLKDIILQGLYDKNLAENSHVKFVDVNSNINSDYGTNYLETERNMISIPDTSEIKNHSLKGIDIVSFSSMHQSSHESEELEVLADDNISKIEEALEEPEDIWDITEDVVMLPKGTRTGLMLHEIFEQINWNKIMSYRSFEDFKSDVISSDENLINQIFLKYSTYFPKDLTEEYKENIYKIVWNTLHTKLDFASISIGEIKQKICELKFTSPYKRSINGTEKEDFITGIIDMIFKVGDKYYILDWKSNISSTGKYEIEDIEEIMALHNYDFQAQIYGDGLKRWLSSINISEKKYAGYVYVFLRKAEIQNEASLCTRVI